VANFLTALLRAPLCKPALGNGAKLSLIALGAFAGSPIPAATITVPADYSTIQEAIDAAVPGDAILVEPGTYSENLSLRSQIDLAGSEAARTIIEPADSAAPVITIGSATDVHVSNLTLPNATTAVSTTFSTEIIISNIIFRDAADVAIDIDNNSEVEVVNNVFFANESAIQRTSANVGVVNNIFRDNGVTISSDLDLIDNNLNVDSNCWSNNADLLVGGIDTSYGTNAVTGNPELVDSEAGDFHLRQGSPCIDIGSGTDIIDGTQADAGAYGGDFADSAPFPVAEPTLRGTASPTVEITVSWLANLGYLVTNDESPGGYRVYYRKNASGPPYDGTDADGGLAPSPITVGDSTSRILNNLTPSPPPAAAPMLLSATGTNAAVALSWTEVVNATGYRIRYGVDSVDENQIDVAAVSSTTVTGLSNGTTYRFAISALSQARYYVVVTAFDNTAAQNESAPSTESSLAIGPVLESPDSNELSALPELILAYPVLPDEDACFIATAAYGADWTRQVVLLRQFRDEYLLTNAAGKLFVKLYYRYSPPLAAQIRDRPAVRAIVRGLLTPLVALAWLLLEASVPFQIASGALVAAAGAWMIVARRRTRTTARNHRQRGF
jgi:hypothetical protein